MSDRDPKSTRPEIQRIIDAAKRIDALLDQLRRAILDGDSELEHALARQVCGLPREQRYEKGERIL